MAACWVLYKDGRILREPSKANHMINTWGVYAREPATPEGLANLQALRKKVGLGHKGA